MFIRERGWRNVQIQKSLVQILRSTDRSGSECHGLRLGAFSSARHSRDLRVTGFSARHYFVRPQRRLPYAPKPVRRRLRARVTGEVVELSTSGFDRYSWLTVEGRVVTKISNSCRPIHDGLVSRPVIDLFPFYSVRIANRRRIYERKRHPSVLLLLGSHDVVIAEARSRKREHKTTYRLCAGKTGVRLYSRY